MTAKHHFDSQMDYDDYVESTPLEARFDYLTIQLAVTEAFEKHKAYGMSFSEYRVQRSHLSGYDETDKKRLSYYLPPFYARVSSDLALINNASHHQFMIMMIELGLIHFQVDYREEYNNIRDGRTHLFRQMNSKHGENTYMQMDKQTISLGSCSGAKFGHTKHFAPSVPEWLYNANSEISNYLNMSGSDLVFLSFCMALLNCLDDTTIPRPVIKNATDTVDKFDYEIKAYSKRITDLLTI